MKFTAALIFAGAQAAKLEQNIYAVGDSVCACTDQPAVGSAEFLSGIASSKDFDSAAALANLKGIGEGQLLKGLGEGQLLTGYARGFGGDGRILTDADDF